MNDEHYLPKNVTLPFFAYGLFKPGQLGIFRLEDCLERIESNIELNAKLWERDGIPILELKGNKSVEGALLFFKSGKEADAYKKIADIEPKKTYRWDTVAVNGEMANVLVGISPRKGSGEISHWDGREDPFFKDALEFIEENASKLPGHLEVTASLRHDDPWDFKPLFMAQALYGLLWTVIERYTGLRYHLGKDVIRKIENLDHELSFGNALKALDPSRDENTVHSTCDPKKPISFDRNCATKCRKYFYQVRSNSVHRGKGVPRDYERIKECIEDLLFVFGEVKTEAFLEAERIGKRFTKEEE